LICTKICKDKFHVTQEKTKVFKEARTGEVENASLQTRFAPRLSLAEWLSLEGLFWWSEKAQATLA
jgi:hypothetical protein